MPSRATQAIPTAAQEPLPQPVVSWLANRGLLQLQATAIQQPANLLVNAYGLTISNDIDFGMHQVVKGGQQGQLGVKTSPGTELHTSSNSSVQYGKPLDIHVHGVSSDGCDNSSKERSAPAEGVDRMLQLPQELRTAVAGGEMVLRQMTITNTGTSPIWLVNVWVVSAKTSVVLLVEHICPSKEQFRNFQMHLFF